MRVTGHVQRIRPGQAPKTIIEEAREIRASAIVMQLTYRNRHAALRQDAAGRPRATAPAGCSSPPIRPGTTVAPSRLPVPRLAV